MVAAVAGKITNLVMGASEARALVDRIHEHLNRADYHLDQARSLILDLKVNEGWRALGYTSWGACVQTEFKRSSASVYRQLNAALVELEISPNGGIGAINERTLRPLTKKGYSQAAREGIWAIANEVVSDGGKITGGVVEVVIETIKEILVSEATDSEFGMHPLTERVHAQVVEAVRQKKLAHKEHIKRLDAERDYILGGREIHSMTRAITGGKGRVLMYVPVENSIEADKLTAALRSGKPIYCSLWTE